MPDASTASDMSREWVPPQGDSPQRTQVSPPPAGTQADLFPIHALTNALWLSAVVTFVLVAWVLVDRHGWAYYTTPIGVRGYHPAHKALRPSGPVGHLLGIGGWLMMFMPVVYMVRKRVRVSSASAR